MNIALIGTGAWGKNHAKTLAKLKGDGLIEQVFVCDADGGKAKEMAKEVGANAISFDGVLNNKEIYGVIVATPSPTHYQLAKKLLEAGKDVLVEKPLTLDVKQAQELIRLAEQQKRVLMVGHEFRFHPGITKAKELLDSGALGKPLLLSAERLDFRTARKDMGVLYALAIHDLDLFCFVLGRKPETVCAELCRATQDEVEDHCLVSLSFGGVKAFATESWIVPTGKKREFVIIGTKASVLVDFMKHDSVEVFEVKDGKVVQRTETFAAKAPLEEELKHFIECISTRKKPLADGAVGLEAMRLVEACLDSAKRSKAISFS